MIDHGTLTQYLFKNIKNNRYYLLYSYIIIKNKILPILTTSIINLTLFKVLFNISNDKLRKFNNYATTAMQRLFHPL